MTTLQGIVAFAAVARHESFAGAARELALSPSAVGKSVARLEQRLGLRLFQRTTRRVSLTEDGRALYERSKRILEDVEELEAAAQGARSEPQGTLRLNAPLTYGRKIVVPALARLARLHPQLRFDLQLSDVRVDLVAARLDAVVRIGELASSGFVARRIDTHRLIICASPGYLERSGAPRTAADLAAHRWIRFRLPSTGRERPIDLRVRGRRIELMPGSHYVFDDGEAMVGAALEGLGLTQIPDYMAEAELASGALREVLAECRPDVLPVSVLHSDRSQRSPRLRALIQALVSFAAERRTAPRAAP